MAKAVTMITRTMEAGKTATKAMITMAEARVTTVKAKARARMGATVATIKMVEKVRGRTATTTTMTTEKAVEKVEERTTAAKAERVVARRMTMTMAKMGRVVRATKRATPAKARAAAKERKTTTANPEMVMARSNS